jgi:uncharacterized Zn finger protein
MSSVVEPLCASCGYDVAVVTFEPAPEVSLSSVRCGGCGHVFENTPRGLQPE